MESNGEALKIHMSHTTKQILDRWGTFETTMRGFVSIKGKGEMMTFWLDGEKTNPAPQQQQLPSALVDPNHNLTEGIVNGIHHHPSEKPPSKIVAVVPPMTPQNSFNSKKSVTISNHNRSLNNSLKDLSHTPLMNGRRFFPKKKQVTINNNENMQPLLTTTIK